MEQLEVHCSTEHKCPHLSCTTQSKNATALKEHVRNKHNIKCDVVCQGEFHSVNHLIFNSLHFVAGQRHQINRDTISTDFRCPICPFTANTTKEIQKHCRDHTLEPTVRRVTNRYHPYGPVNTSQDPPPEIIEDVVMAEVDNGQQDLQDDITPNSSGKLYKPNLLMSIV